MNSLSLAIRSVLSKYATFSGRASRSEFWLWVLAMLIFFTITQIIDAFVIAPMLGFEVWDENAGQPLSLVFSLILLSPTLAVSARRLHDIGKSGWWLLIGFIPIIGVLVLLWFSLQRSTAENV